MNAIVVSVNISSKKGEKKYPIEKITLIKNHGVYNDAHANSSEIRQVSLLDVAEIDGFKNNKIFYGDFAENITTKGLNIDDVKVGTILSIGSTVIKVTQIGKTCHSGCNIQKILGQCIMPTKGIFGIVLKGGLVKPGKKIVAVEGLI